MNIRALLCSWASVTIELWDSYLPYRLSFRSSFVPAATRQLGTTMDSSNQKFYDDFLQYSIISSAVIALCVGFFTWSFRRMLIVYIIGVLLTMVVVVPDWEFFTKRPISEWIEPMALDEESRLLQKARFPILKKTAKYAKREDIHPLGIVFFLAVVSCCVYYTWKFITS